MEPGLQGPRGRQLGRQRGQRGGGRRLLLSRLLVGARLPGSRAGQPQTAVVQLADVLLEIKVPAKALAARGAGERLLVVVGVHVEGQVVDLVEGLVADGAFVLLLAAVGQLMVLVVPYKRPKTKK